MPIRNETTWVDLCLLSDFPSKAGVSLRGLGWRSATRVATLRARLTAPTVERDAATGLPEATPADAHQCTGK